ncbi:MAG: amidase [Candidatus Aminicenantes bacterium]|nr:MAG: amidase [Candidatus Aminicenantes bacterium]
MKKAWIWFVFLTFLLIFLSSFPCCKKAANKEEGKMEGFIFEEATIASIHKAFKKGQLTSRQLVDYYLERIEKYDQSSGLNAIVVINPDAQKRADYLDKTYSQTKKLRPLHGIPIIVKDNYETKDMQTTAGSLALKGFIPPEDAYQVRKLREAGAIILAKSNMAEWAFSPLRTESSIAGITKNPYDLERVPAGSSGGTAAAVAANFGTIGLGTDTGNSIRGPSSHCCLVGIRSTMGLTSRDGIIPLYLRNDIGGPMGRTVEDAVKILELIAGYDPSDPITERCKDLGPYIYTSFLDKNGLEGARIGVFRYYTDKPTADPQIRDLFDKAIEDMKSCGAEIVDPFVIPDFEELTKGIWCDMFCHDLNHYLASLGGYAPYKTLSEIVNTGQYSPYIERRLKRALEVPQEKEVPCLDVYCEPKNIAFRGCILQAMEEFQLDAIVYPTWSNPPRKIDDNKSPAGDNSQLIPPHTGFPAITVPMGFNTQGLPTGLQIVGKLFEEPIIIQIAYAYERATQHRKPPPRFSAAK